MELDFFKINHRKIVKKEELFIDVYPDFLVKPSKHLMIRGGKFYAVLDRTTGFWVTDEYQIQEYVDEELRKYAIENADIQKEMHRRGIICHLNVLNMVSSRSRSWIEYKNYVNNLPDHYHQLDDRLCFDTDKVNPKDYISKKLPYKLEKGSYESWDKLVGTLYAPDERKKIEWAIGAIVAGDSKDIQKFLVLYGDPGAGKGTILKIIQKLFPGYYEVFDAKSLSTNSNAFAFEQFRSNPLIALQMDGDLSKIEDNTKLNSLVSHETIMMNEKRKQSYSFTPRCFLFMASNREVKITDAKSGILRRLIDVNPSGVTLPKREYDRLMSQINFELSGIAWHCLEVYQQMGKNYYNSYQPTSMMIMSNPIFNFMKDTYEDPDTPDIDAIRVQDLYALWLQYCEVSGITNRLARYQFVTEVTSYYREFYERTRYNGMQQRNFLKGLKTEKFYNDTFGKKDIPHNDPTFGLVLDQKTSLLDEMLKDCPAQYAEDDGHGGSKPILPWSQVTTTLGDLDTTRLHFVRLPKNHIVIDFDLKNEKGEKDSLLNLEAADKWPKTYAEYSQGGKGIHLHYIYDGDPEELASLYSKDIEIKISKGKSSLRRRVSGCNAIPVAVINCGLPKKEVKKDDMVDFEAIENEKHLRNIISKCLKKEIAQPYTSPAMDLIEKTLSDAYKAGVKYDIRDMRPAICAFAAKSHNQKDKCMKIANSLHYFSHHFDDDHKWDGSIAGKKTPASKALYSIEPVFDLTEPVEARPISPANENYVFFDIEVFPNLLLVNWKEAGEDKGVVRMINPTRQEIGELLNRRLIGFNCRRYDNHILYARYIGYDIPAIYQLSQRIISGSKNSMFGEAYNLSYTDVYDFAAKKQSLKKWEIELGIHHQELGLPWDQPVPKERWTEVAEYCDNDVLATEAVFNHLAGDFKAREILADIAGMSVNDTTNMLTTRIIFGDDPKPQVQFNYPNLEEKFPGYIFENGKSYYRHRVNFAGKPEGYFEVYREPAEMGYQESYRVGHTIYPEERVYAMNIEEGWIEVVEEIGEGGRVYAWPGIHRNVITFDVASMHPSSIIAENGFGKYTERFKQLMDIRVAIKHKDFDKAKAMLDGKLAKYLTDKDQAKALSQALKIAINSVYGLTAAGFDNKFRDPRNKDNWVAKRGALFIETLRLKVMEMGGEVVHIKTDSIKVEEPTEEIKNFIMDYGKQWGYTFEIEDIYEKMCLVNDAVYIALRDRNDPSWLDECDKARKKAEAENKAYTEPTRWSATGAQFQHPYVFKALFSHEPIVFKDLCETKTVTSALYLDFNENLADVSQDEKDLEKLMTRVKKLLKACGYSGTFQQWLDEGHKREEYSEHPEIFEELKDLAIDKSVMEETIAKGHNYAFIGRAGSFCPVKAGMGGGVLVREKDGKYNAATGTKGFRWREGESLKGADRMDMIDMGYFDALGKSAIEAIEAYGDFGEFASEAAPRPSSPAKVMPARQEISKIMLTVYPKEPAVEKKEELPWRPPCGNPEFETCYDCPMFDVFKIPPECRKGYDLSDQFIVNTTNRQRKGE